MKLLIILFSTAILSSGEVIPELSRVFLVEGSLEDFLNAKTFELQTPVLDDSKIIGRSDIPVSKRKGRQWFPPNMQQFQLWQYLMQYGNGLYGRDRYNGGGGTLTPGAPWGVTPTAQWDTTIPGHLAGRNFGSFFLQCAPINPQGAYGHFPIPITTYRPW